MHSAYLDASAALLAVSGSRDFYRRGFNARPPEQLLREPRGIEAPGYKILYLTFGQPSPTIDAFRFVDRVICVAGDLLIFRRQRKMMSRDPGLKTGKPFPLCTIK